MFVSSFSCLGGCIGACIRISSKYCVSALLLVQIWSVLGESNRISPDIFLVIWKCLYHCDPAAQDLEEFWSHEATTEWFRRHPILQVTWRGLPHKCHRGAWYMSSVYIKVTDPRWVIPLRFFGDGAESYSPLSKNHATNKHWLYPCWSLSHGWHPVQGKHKFEILTLVLPLAKSSSTMDNRILSHGLSRCFCQWPKFSTEFICWKHPLLDPSRLSCMSGSYCNDDSRKLILQTLAWSFNCLSAFSCKRVPYVGMFDYAKFILLVEHVSSGLRQWPLPISWPLGETFHKGLLQEQVGPERAAHCRWLPCHLGGNPRGPRFHSNSFFPITWLEFILDLIFFGTNNGLETKRVKVYFEFKWVISQFVILWLKPPNKLLWGLLPKTCKVFSRVNSAVIIAEQFNGSMRMKTRNWLSICTQILGDKHPTGTRTKAVLTSIFLGWCLVPQKMRSWYDVLETNSFKASHRRRMAGCERQ